MWKPSEKTPLSAIATQRIFEQVLRDNELPEGISCLVVGDYKVGQWLAADERVPLVSATGSTRMGKVVAQTVAGRLGRSLLELGGNNAIIVTESADMDLTTVAVLFGAVGTAGQRCTTTRRLIVQEDVYEDVKQRLVRGYQQLRIGNPLDQHNHVGPLIDKGAVEQYLQALDTIRAAGGRFLIEGEVMEGEGYESGCYVRPCLVEVDDAIRDCAARNLCAHFVPVEIPHLGRSDALAKRSAARFVFRHDDPKFARSRILFVCPPARIAALPTSTLGLRERKLAGLLVGKKKRAAAANPVRMRGKLICAAKRTPSTTVRNCRWRRGLSLNFKDDCLKEGSSDNGGYRCFFVAIFV